MTSKAIVCALAAGAIGLGVAACGGSTAPGVQLAPEGGATQDAVTAAATTATSTTTSTTANLTPKTGALAHEPVVTIPSGAAPKHLVTRDIIAGTGASAAEGDTLTVNYVGKVFKTGKVFDSSWSRNETFAFTLSSGSVIPGWVQGLAGMKVGGRRELIIPPNLAYGASAEGSIPANSTLVFVVDLLKVSK